VGSGSPRGGGKDDGVGGSGSECVGEVLVAGNGCAVVVGSGLSGSKLGNIHMQSDAAGPSGGTTVEDKGGRDWKFCPESEWATAAG